MRCSVEPLKKSCYSPSRQVIWRGIVTARDRMMSELTVDDTFVILSTNFSMRDPLLTMPCQRHSAGIGRIYMFNQYLYFIYYFEMSFLADSLLAINFRDRGLKARVIPTTTI